MKILWLCKSFNSPEYNHWYRIDFVKYLKNNFNLDILVYGKNSNKNYPELSPIKYSSKKTLKDLKKEFNFDIIIIDGYNRNLTHKKLTGIMKNIKNYSVIYMEGDFQNFYEKPNYSSWLKNINPKIILYRHRSNIIKAQKEFPEFNSKWFPCSVDNTIFKPDYNIKIIKKIVFIGSDWTSRKKYLKILKKNNLADLFRRPDQTKKEFKKFIGHFYIQTIQKYISAFNHSGTEIQNVDNAKMFEIMSCGSVLLTNECDNGVKELFSKGSYVLYKNEKDMIDKAKWIIEHPKEREIITNKALKCIAERHTHKVRAKQLINIIKQEFKI